MLTGLANCQICFRLKKSGRTKLVGALFVDKRHGYLLRSVTDTAFIVDYMK